MKDCTLIAEKLEKTKKPYKCRKDMSPGIRENRVLVYSYFISFCHRFEFRLLVLHVEVIL